MQRRTDTAHDQIQTRTHSHACSRTGAPRRSNASRSRAPRKDPHRRGRAGAAAGLAVGVGGSYMYSRPLRWQVMERQTGRASVPTLDDISAHRCIPWHSDTFTRTCSVPYTMCDAGHVSTTAVKLYSNAHDLSYLRVRSSATCYLVALFVYTSVA